MDLEKKQVIPTVTFVPKIDLQHSILGQKYCVYQLLEKKGYKLTYSAINIYDKQLCKLELFRLYEIKDEQEKRRLKYKQLRKAQLHNRIFSDFFIKCYDVYENQNYLAFVYENVDGQSLQDDISSGILHDSEIDTIVYQMHQAMECIHSFGFLVKHLDLNNIYYKQGVYKLADFSMFEIPCIQNSNELAQQLLTKQSEQAVYNIKEKKCEVWALSFLYLKLLLSVHKIKVDFSIISENAESLYSWRIQQKLQNFLDDKDKSRENAHEILKCGLVYNYQNRMNWQKLTKLIYIPSIYQRQTFKKSWQDNPKNSFNHNKDVLMMISNNFETVIQDFICTYDNLQNMQRNFNNLMIIKNFSFIAITGEDLYIHIRSYEETEKSKNLLFKQYRNLYFALKVSEFIYENIIIPIRNIYEDRKKRLFAEFQYLLIFRCYIDFSSGHQRIKKLPIKWTKNIIDWVDKKQKQIKNIFEIVSAELTSKQSQNLQMVIDFFRKRIKKPHEKQKQKYLAGIQGIDFTKKQQIKFTINYIHEIEKYLNQYDQSQYLIKLCLNYDKMMQFSVENYHQLRINNFQIMIRDLILSK